MGIMLYNRGGIERLFGNVIYYALSVAHLKKLKQEVVLYTDALGKALLGYLPYDEIHMLDAAELDSIHPRFFAAGKFVAMEKEGLDAIHIDHDVFIKDTKCLNRIKRLKGDLLVQNFEASDWFVRNVELFKNDEEYCKSQGLDYNDFDDFNTGIIQFKNQELKDKFIRGYKNLARHFTEKFASDLSLNDHQTPDLVIEQQYIRQCAKGYKTSFLLDPKDGETNRAFCNDIGYHHICGSHKYSAVDRAMNELQSINNKIYNETKELCRTVLK